MLWYDNVDGLVWTELEDTHSQDMLLTPSCIYCYISVEAEYNVSLRETAYLEAVHSEHIFLSTSGIDYVWHMH